MRSLRPLALTLVAVLGMAGVAEARSYNIPSVLKDDVKRVTPRVNIAIRLPARLDLAFNRRVFTSATGSRRRYSFGLAGIRDCGGAGACTLGSISGERGGTPAYRGTVRLTNGITGYYKPLTCGASCSDPEIQWLQGGVLYSISASLRGGKAKQRRAMVKAANQSIRATPR